VADPGSTKAENVWLCPECGEEVQDTYDGTQKDCCNDQWIRLQIERCYA